MNIMNPINPKIAVVILFIIIIYLYFRLRYYKSEYHSLLLTGLHMKRFIMVNDLDDKWRDTVNNIGREDGE